MTPAFLKATKPCSVYLFTFWVFAYSIHCGSSQPLQPIVARDFFHRGVGLAGGCGRGLGVGCSRGGGVTLGVGVGVGVAVTVGVGVGVAVGVGVGVVGL